MIESIDYNDTKIEDTPFILEDYLYGRCNLFAIALSELTGLTIGGLFEMDFIDDTELHCLSHAFCVIDENTVIDGNGIQQLKHLLPYYYHQEIQLDATSYIKEQTHLNLYPNFIENEKNALKEFIINVFSNDLKQYNINI